MEELNKEATEIVDEKIKEVASSLEKKENKKIKKVFKAKCFHCKDTEIVTLDNGMEYKMPYAEIDIPKDKEMLKEFKEYAKESEEKYKSPRVIKRGLFNYCPKCGHTINVCCKDYVDFYTPKKENKK